MLEWMLLQKNPDSERIEELVGDELRNIIKEAPSVACYFCKCTRRCLCIVFPQSSSNAELDAVKIAAV